MNYHFIQPIGDNILLSGARCHLYTDEIAEKNALIITKAGEVISEICFGDGIEHVIVTPDNRIITSYFDEGIFGNYGWDNPIGCNGLIVWNDKGDILWEASKYPIYDCYAMNVDDEYNLWFYYYDEFKLVKTNYRKDIVYQPEISGSGAFLITKNGRCLIFDGDIISILSLR